MKLTKFMRKRKRNNHFLFFMYILIKYNISSSKLYQNFFSLLLLLAYRNFKYFFYEKKIFNLLNEKLNEKQTADENCV